MPRNLPYAPKHFNLMAMLREDARQMQIWELFNNGFELPYQVTKFPKKIERMKKKTWAEIVNHQSYLKLDRQIQERQKEREECARSVHLCYFGKVLSSYVAIAYGLIATGVIH